LHVGVASSADCSPQLRVAADAFIDVSEALVESWESYYT